MKNMFRMQRYFSITSLAGILLTAALLAVFYREVAIGGIVRLGEKGNVIVAQTVLTTMHDQLVEHLALIADRAGRHEGSVPLPDGLRRAMQGVMRDSKVVRIKILDQRGIVVFSSKSEQTGADERENPDFTSAIRGNTSSKLLYRDRFNLVGEVTEDDNLIETYLPVRRSPMSPVLGVFEFYTDVTSMVRDTEFNQLVIAIGGTVILMFLYGALLVIMRHAQRLIERQENVIQERTQTLELVTARLLAGQENERKRIAGGLHEGLAQTLSAIKFNFENALRLMRQDRTDPHLQPLEGVLQALQGTIQDVRALAMELRPPSLDELGLLDTLNWYFHRFRDAHPGVGLTAELNIEEQSVPDHLKTIVYRVVQEVLEHLTRQHQANAVCVALVEDREHLVLTVSDNGQPYRPGGDPSPLHEGPTVAAKERVVLSGGTFAVEATPWGAMTVRASWPLVRARLRSIA